MERANQNLPQGKTMQPHSFSDEAMSTMSSDRLHVSIRTPQEMIFEAVCDSIRVPTESGQVGFRSRAEASVLAVEAGLILLKSQNGTSYAGTVGGLLRISGHQVSLLTPLAVAGQDVESVSQQLDRLLAAPSGGMEVRRVLGQLETRILQEVQQRDAANAPGFGRTS